MHTGYDNYWMCNRQEVVSNLLKNDNISRGVSLDSYKQIQDERQQSLLTRYLSSRSNIINKTQSILGDQQILPQYPWTPTACGQSSRPYSYHNGPGLQQKDPRIYYQRPGAVDSRGNIPQMNNNVLHVEGQNNNNTTQTPRIRVRDVNSLNNMARSSMLNSMQQRQFDRYSRCPFNVNERQQNLPQKSNTEHANHIPSLFEVNPFQPTYQRPTQLPKQLGCQEQFDPQQKRREQYIPGNQYHPNNIRRNEPSNELPTSLLEELLNFTRTQLDTIQNSETLHNPPTVNNNMTKNNNLNLTNLLEGSYNPGQSSFRNPPPYPETLQNIEVPLTTQGSSLPIVEPISPPLVENNVTQSAQPIRVTAVISLPNLSDINSNNSSQVSVSRNDKSNYTPDSTTKECENLDCDISITVPNSESLKVKEETMLNSTFSNEENNIEIVIQTMKTETIQDENVQKTESNKEQSCSTNNTDINGAVSKNSQTQKDKSPSDAVVTEPKNKSDVSDVKLESNYKSQINRDKLDRLIEFLNGDEHPPYVNEQSSEMGSSKKPKKVEGKEKVNKLSSDKTVNLKEPIQSKVPRVEITRCSSEPSQNVTNDDCLKKSQNNSESAKQSELNDSSEKVRIKNVTKNAGENADVEDNSEKKQITTKKRAGNSGTSLCLTETVDTPKSTEKMRADVTQSEKPTEKEIRLQDNQGEVLSFPTLEENKTEKPKKNEIPKALKPESKIFPLKSNRYSTATVELFQEINEAKDTERTEKANLRIFPNFNYHFCSNCNLVSPIEWFWINAVTGDLKCLNCFKRTFVDSSESTNKLSLNDSENADPPTESHKSPVLKNTPAGDVEKQTNQNASESETKPRWESRKEKRKSIDDTLFQERKEKKRKTDDKSDKKVEGTKVPCAKEDKSRKLAECLKVDKQRKSFTKYRNQGPKAEVRPGKDSINKFGRPPSKEKHATEEGVKKTRRNSKEDLCAKKSRVVEESAEESHANQKLKKLKESFQRAKTVETEEIERRRKSASKEKDFPLDKEKKLGDNKKSKHVEKISQKMPHSVSEDTVTKPLKEKQNTKVKVEKQCEKQKKPEKEEAKPMKEDGEKKIVGEKKAVGEKKSSNIKGPLQYKDFVLNKPNECCFPEMFDSFPLRKIMDISKKKCERSEERCATLFAKLKKKTKSLSMNLLKDT